MHKDLLLNKEDTTMTKRIYNQPEVSVAQINMLSIICASGAAGSGANKINPGVETNVQW